jgi:hypothetical protein
LYFFLNYNRLNMKMSYEVMDESINEFFEKARADKVRAAIKEIKNPQEREQVFLTAITEALKEDVPAHTLTFGFRTREGGGTSHHLVYATKNAGAVNQMKRIYTKASSDIADGVGSLDFDPRDAEARTLPLFSRLEEVRERLLATFAGRTIRFDELIRLEVGTSYTDTAYRNALLDLEEEKRVIMDPPSDKRRRQRGGERSTLPGTTTITFPS